MGDAKAQNVLEYLQNLEAKGKASSGAIRPLKIAFAKVLQNVDGENWENTDVRTINIDDYMARFANLTMGKYSSDSLSAYKSRLTRALSWYLQFLEKPGWTPDVNQRARKEPAKKAAKATAPLKQLTPLQTLPETPISSGSTIEPRADQIVYPFPLLDGQLIHISLPVKLSRTDARRIGGFIESISIDTKEEQNE